MLSGYFLLAVPLQHESGLIIYPPKVQDVFDPKLKYQAYKQVLTLSHEDIEDDIIKKSDKEGVEPDFSKAITPFEFLLMNCYNNKNFKKIVEEAFKFFFKAKVSFLYDKKEIWIGDIEKIVANAKTIKDLENVMKITEKNYFSLQNLIRNSVGEESKEPPNPNEHIKVKRIKAKGRERERIKAKTKAGLSLESSLIAICCMNMGLNPLNIGELSLASINYLISMYQQKERYQIDIDSLIGGADSKKVKPKYWITNLEK